MATYPPGILSFLYNVMNDTEINEKFRDPKQRQDVMEFFMLKDNLRKIFKDASTRFYDERKKLSTERLSKLGLSDTEATEYPPYELSYDEAKRLAEKEFERYSDDVKTLLKVVEEELKECYGRFW